MRKLLITAFLILFASISFAGNVETLLKNNLQANFAKRGLKDIEFNIKIIKKLDSPKGYYFVKVSIFDKKRNRKVQQYLLTDGNYIIPDIINIKNGTSLVKELTFEYDKVNIDTKNLTLMQGDKNAKNIIIKISDFQCPFCRRAYQYLEPKIKNRKDIALYMLNFPLPIHKKAMIYAKVFEAGMKMGHNFADELYSGKFDSKKDEEIIDYFAKKTGNPEKFKKLVNSDEIKNRIELQKKIAEKKGFRATPVFLFNGKKVEGYDRKLIDKALKSMQ